MTRTAADKMRVKPGSRAHIVNGPAAVVAAMRLPELDLADDLVGEFDYLHLFVTAQDDMRQSFPRLAERLHLGGALWVSWPKGGRHGSDLNLKSVIRIGYDFGMVESTCLRVDEVWAALKFTHPKPGKTYCNSYGTLPPPRPLTEDPSSLEHGLSGGGLPTQPSPAAPRRSPRAGATVTARCPRPRDHKPAHELSMTWQVASARVL